MNIYKQSFKNFKLYNFQRDIENINWVRATKIDQKQTN